MKLLRFSFLVTTLLLAVFFTGCSESEDVVDGPVTTETYTGVLEAVPDAKKRLFDVSHGLVTDSDLVYLRSLIYDLDDRLYEDALLRITGVPREVSGKKTLTVDRVVVLEADYVKGDDLEENDTDLEEDIDEGEETDESDDSESIDEDSVEEDEVADKDVTEVADPEIKVVENIVSVKPLTESELSALSPLDSRPLEFKMFYPKKWYYAQVAGGYAFALDSVDDKDNSSWIAYIKVSEKLGVELKKDWVSFKNTIGGREFVVFGNNEDAKLLQLMLRSISVEQ